MIAYLPEIYSDETVYSWFSRYYAHSGYPGYVSALEDLLENRYAKTDMEFFGRLNHESKSAIDKMYGLGYLIEKHTMFPQYARFESKERQQEARTSLVEGGKDIHYLLRFPKSQETRTLRYCPLCAAEDRKRYGEAYWHRAWLIRGMDICAEHRCGLMDTDIPIRGKSSPRLYPAEEVIGETEIIYEDNPVISGFSSYLLDVFHQPIPETEQPGIGAFLTSRLEGTPYISARGKRKYIRELEKDLNDYYKDMPGGGLEYQRLVKIFMGSVTNFYDICAVAFFLRIPAEELADRRLPEKSQTERFNEIVAELSDKGYGRRRIENIVGSCATSALRAKQEKRPAERNYAVRKGMKKTDWDSVDEQSVEKVRHTCEQIYHGELDDGRPRKVSQSAVTRALGWPDKRLDYLPRCRAIVEEYQETQQEYWAREIEWARSKLLETKSPDEITDSQVWKMLNLRKKNFEKTVNERCGIIP